MNSPLSLYFSICVACSSWKLYAITDGITASQSLRDGETLVSNGGSFELGFQAKVRSELEFYGLVTRMHPRGAFRLYKKARFHQNYKCETSRYEIFLGKRKHGSKEMQGNMLQKLFLYGLQKLGY